MRRFRHNAEQLSQQELSRRQVLQWAAAGCVFSSLPSTASASKLFYPLNASKITDDTWAVYGLPEYFSSENGGHIVNVAFIDAGDGVVVIDTGTSKRFGEALRSLIEATVPGKPIIRVYNTHHHPDHVFGNQAFDTQTIAGTTEMSHALSRDGNAFADNLYRLLGDWMRGTDTVLPGTVVAAGRETVGNRSFIHTPLDGHTESDLLIQDEATGVLFSGDLSFLYRAPTTPSADLPSWHSALNTMQSMDVSMILPGHGPVDPTGESITQTRDYLIWLEGALREAVSEGLTMNEAMALDIPNEFSGLYVVRTEFERSVVHLYRQLEDEIFEGVDVSR